MELRDIRRWQDFLNTKATFFVHVSDWQEHYKNNIEQSTLRKTPVV